MRYIVLFILMTLVSKNSLACSCRELSPKEAFGIYDIIVLGKIVNINVIKHEINRNGQSYSLPHTKEATMLPLHFWKGSNHNQYLNFITSSDSSACGYPITLDSYYILYLQENNRGVSKISSCGKNKNILEEPNKGIEAIIQLFETVKEQKNGNPK